MAAICRGYRPRAPLIEDMAVTSAGPAVGWESPAEASTQTEYESRPVEVGGFLQRSIA